MPTSAKAIILNIFESTNLLVYSIQPRSNYEYVMNMMCYQQNRFIISQSS